MSHSRDHNAPQSNVPSFLTADDSLFDYHTYASDFPAGFHFELSSVDHPHDRPQRAVTTSLPLTGHNDSAIYNSAASNLSFRFPTGPFNGLQSLPTISTLATHNGAINLLESGFRTAIPCRNDTSPVASMSEHGKYTTHGELDGSQATNLPYRSTISGNLGASYPVLPSRTNEPGTDLIEQFLFDTSINQPCPPGQDRPHWWFRDSSQLPDGLTRHHPATSSPSAQEAEQSPEVSNGKEDLYICEKCRVVFHILDKYRKHRRKECHSSSRQNRAAIGSINIPAPPRRMREKRGPASGDGFYFQISGCDRAEGSNWPFARKDNLAIHMRNVHQPDKSQKGLGMARNRHQGSMLVDSCTTASSTNPPTAETTGFDDSFGEHASSPNTSHEAASTVADADGGGCENAENDPNIGPDLTDLSAFGDFVPDWAMYQGLDMLPPPVDWDPVGAPVLDADAGKEVAASGTYTGADTAAIPAPNRSIVKRAVYDMVRNKFVVPPSPLPRDGPEVKPNHNVQIAKTHAPTPPADMAMLEDFDFEALWEMSVDLPNDDLHGLFGNSSPMKETDYHS